MFSVPALLKFFKLPKFPQNTQHPFNRSNQSVLKEISPEYSLEGLMLKLLYFGHLMRGINSLEKTLILGKIEGRRRRGRQRMRWIDAIADSMGQIWASSGRCWRARKPDVLQSMGSQKVCDDWVIEQQLLSIIFRIKKIKEINGPWELSGLVSSSAGTWMDACDPRSRTWLSDWKQTNTKIKKTFLILWFSTLKSTVVQDNSCHTGDGIQWISKKSYWMEEGEEEGDSRAERWSATGGQAVISLTPDVDGEGNGNPLQYSCLENPMDGGAW